MNTQEIANAAIWDHGAQQKEDELKAVMDFLIKEKVQSILEIGCDAGGTLFAWSKIATKIVGISLFNGGFSSGIPLRAHNADIIHGNSHDPNIVTGVMSIAPKDGFDFLFIDGDHTYAGVHNDFWHYKHMVKPDGWIGFHDICEFTAETNDLKVHIFWQDLIKTFPAAEVKEFKQFPYSWGGIGLIRNRPNAEYLPEMGLVCCENGFMFQGKYDPELLLCEFPKDHNLGVASQHYSKGVYWW